MWNRADDDLDDREWPDEDDDDHGDDEDDDPTAPCPHCGASVYDDAERCPRCGRYLSREDAPRPRPAWVVLGLLACLAVVLTWIFGRG